MSEPALREPLAAAIEEALMRPLDEPPVPTVDRVLAVLANNRRVVIALAVAFTIANANADDPDPFGTVAATLFGEANDG